MRYMTVLSLIGTLMVGSADAGTCPEHFSPAAKELLADAVQLEESEHQLNVIYFLGSDAEPVPGYERRLSELLLYLQQYYGKEMQRNGYGLRSFGLDLKENGEVKIHVLRAPLPAAEYGYDKGPGRSLEVLAQFFEAHPELRRSNHSFIIMPTFYNAEYNDANPGGVPFYGFGKDCFALDYKEFDIRHLGKDTPEGRLLTKWYGGFAHELGHGLNLPHNDAAASLNAALGEPLMRAGNYTFGRKPTYLTPASCAVLDRSETFAVKGDKTAFYAEELPVPEVKDAALKFEDGCYKMNFRCRGAVAHINAYVQDPPYQVNRDYDAVSFCAEQGEPDAEGYRPVSVSIPAAELTALKEDTRRLELLFVATDGSRARWNTEFSRSEAEQEGYCHPVPLEFSPRPSGY